MHRRVLAALLALCLWSSQLYAATSTQYVLPGTAIVFADSAQTPDVTWTLSNRGAGTGQVSARYDLGASAHAFLWDIRCRISLTGTNVVGSSVEYYLAHSDGTNPDGEVGTTNTTITSDQRRALTPIGVLSIYQTTTNTTMTASFHNVYIPGRYVSLAMWNATALATETSTSKHRCVLTPTPVQMQAN